MENKIVFDEKSFQRMEKKQKDLGAVYHRSLWKEACKEIKANPLAIFAVAFLVIIITACLLVSSLGGEPAETAQLFSKEIENGPDNMDAILDAAYTHPAFTDVALLSLLHI